jgi:tellurite resistance protein TerC
VALVVIETSDIVFALDSVPAVLSVSHDPFIVYSSNVMAMLGLRSLFFVVSDVLGRLRFFRFGLAIILAFTGAKMLAANVIHISAAASVLVIAAVLLATVLLSVVPRRSPKRGTV